ncbi:MAG: phage antirepressor KilAC domain-containing protein [Anaeromassilibacillus sp.]
MRAIPRFLWGACKASETERQDIGQNRLFAYLRDNGYLIKRSGRITTLPQQHERGWFTIKERTARGQT